LEPLALEPPESLESLEPLELPLELELEFELELLLDAVDVAEFGPTRPRVWDTAGVPFPLDPLPDPASPDACGPDGVPGVGGSEGAPGACTGTPGGRPRLVSCFELLAERFSFGFALGFAFVLIFAFVLEFGVAGGSVCAAGGPAFACAGRAF
jgi:hypothetical protein